ncbi:MAG: prepilin-type N-terminal cleavage/methylation domain-containing protein [Phycisphaerae bacterium]|jgi:prepilin-type N-terminal cleavage/methylation domain-containing protein|nr:prepilin-type N-terminal cleavage/methylation domain-containing protein [Phycisphaerae bacterium]
MPHVRSSIPSYRSPSARRGFTLTEVLVAVAILVVVIIATARIFGTVSRVTGAGEANADLLQTAAVVERQIRADIARLNREGCLVIRNVEVPNNVNQIGAPGNGPLLNGAIPANATVRCDQLVFFTEGQASSTQFSGSKGIVPETPQDGIFNLPVLQANAARVYYGHAIQLREAMPGTDGIHAGMNSGQPVMPWTYSPPGDDDYKISLVRWDTGAYQNKDIIASQPSSRDWILARQVMLLANDPVPGIATNDPLRYGRQNTKPKNSTAGIWPLASSPTGANFDSGAFSSRVDIAASTIDIIKAFVNPRVRSDGKPWVDNAGIVRGFAPYWTVANHPPDSDPNNWAGQGSYPGQRARMLNTISGAGSNPLRFPRAERVPPKGGIDRADQMLSNPALAFGCSSFTVDWTWEDGTGRMERPNGYPIDPSPANPLDPPSTHVPNYSGDEFVGLILNDQAPQPWFGLNDPTRGVGPLSSMPVYNGSCDNGPGCLGLPIYPSSIEGYQSSNPALAEYSIPGVANSRVYEATFGFNENEPLLEGLNNTNSPNLDRGYTPWPTALRITFTLHDPQQRFPEGRTFQFVVELPKR